MKINSFNYNTLLFFLVRCLFVGICFNNLIIISKLDSWISILIGIIIILCVLLVVKIIGARKIVDEKEEKEPETAVEKAYNPEL